MARVYTTTNIARPIDQVFAYVSTPGYWPDWHPSSLGVSGATDHSLGVGEQVTEEFRVAGRTGRALWTVREHTAPVRWVIEGVIEGRGSGGTVAYMLTPRGETTFFEREFTYPAPTRLFKLLDLLVIRRRVRAESTEALRRLKARLEATTAAPPVM
ncbi:MAG TPA: SRPBCC family protein [Ktedonobacterales bacterium]|nr:SRPBCC family protein [Ktedonobacterales bacterium]